MEQENDERRQEPSAETPPAKPDDEVWAELEVLRQEIDRAWQSEKSAVELVSEQRR